MRSLSVLLLASVLVNAVSYSCLVHGYPADNADAANTTTAALVFQRETQPMKALVSVDGGGLRCVIAVEVLVVIEEAISEFLEQDGRYAYSEPVLLADYFSAFTGANCGAWVASYLASKCGDFACRTALRSFIVTRKYGIIQPGSAKGLRVLFNEFSGMIYPRAQAALLQFPRVTSLPWCLPGLTCALNPAARYRQALQAFIGSGNMNNLPAMLILPTFDLIRRAVVIFASESAEHRRGLFNTITYTFDTDTTPRPACLGCSKTGAGSNQWNTTVQIDARKTYSILDVTQAAGSRVIAHPAVTFRPQLYDVSTEYTCQDTSLVFNNPTLAAITVMDDILSGAEDDALYNISVISIGTGLVDGSLASQAKSGAYQWMFSTQDFYDIVIHGGAELVQSQTDMLLYSVLSSESIFPRKYHAGQYLRIQTEGSANTPKGDVLLTSMDRSNLDELTAIGQETARRFRESIENFVRTFIFGIDLDSREFSLAKQVLECRPDGSRRRPSKSTSFEV